MAYIYYDIYRGLEQNEREQRARVAAAKAQAAADKRTYKNQIQQTKGQIEKSRQQYCRDSESLKALSKETDKRLATLEQNFRVEIGKQRIEFDRQAEALRKKAAALDNNIKAVAGEVDALSLKMDTAFKKLTGQTEAKQKRAAAYCGEFNNIMERIRLLHPEHFDSETNYILNTNYQKAEADYQIGDYDVAIGLAQKNLTTAHQFYLRLLLENDAFQEVLKKVEAKLEELSPLIYNTDNEPDIAYWSNGVFDELVKEFEEIKENVSDCITRYDTNGLKENLTLLENMQEEWVDCFSFAESEEQRSKNVFDTAFRIYEVLKEYNFDLQPNGGAVDGDARNAHKTYYTDGNGVGLNITVYSYTPNDADTGVAIITESTDDRAAVCQMIEAAVTSRLADAGLPLQDYDVAPTAGKSKTDIALEESENDLQSRKNKLTDSMKRRKEVLISNGN